MSGLPTPIVVYHVAGMGDWKSVVPEQLALLRDCGLTDDIRITYLGSELPHLEDLLRQYKINAKIARYSDNLHHCETFAMMEVDQLAKAEKVERPILYMHTKGVSAPGNTSKRDWRHLMEQWVVARWKVNVAYLETHDAVGVNWIEGGPQHFSGTFWIANPDWIKRLPDFEQYHISQGLHRYTCEMWIGAAQWCKALSLGCKNEAFWAHGYDYLRWMPKAAKEPPPGMETVLWDDPFGRIFGNANSDKDTDHSYGDVYQFLYGRDKRLEVRSVLEVGVLDGGSLHAWETAFPRASVYGIDIKPNADKIGKRTSIGIANSAVPKHVRRCMETWGIRPASLDLIVDDGSHRFHDQIATAAILEPYLSPSGIYVIEDIYPFDGAKILAEQFGGVVLDRRAVNERFDDVLVLFGGGVPDVEGLQCRSEKDIPTLFPCDEQ